uniref:Uncharacterized protein n=1 Tax=viral metagenome TaxID=1070528 RepID=A0A6M3ME51_9ZZZZ
MVDLIVFADDSAESKVAQDMIPYFEAVIEEVARHVPEKGYSYKEPEAQKFMIPHLKKLSWKIYKMLDRVGVLRAIEYGEAIGDNPGELLDHTAMAAFVWSHLQGTWSQEYTGVRTQ